MMSGTESNQTLQPNKLKPWWTNIMAKHMAKHMAKSNDYGTFRFKKALCAEGRITKEKEFMHI